jgi:magnesium chelatase accessory protein
VAEQGAADRVALPDFWPHRAASRFVDAGGLRWHLQEFGPRDDPDAPVALLLHGTGASVHSWRGLAPLLATRWRVVAPDLPGHAYTSRPPPGGLSLDGMAQALAALLAALGLRPQWLVGHSAGAAIAARLCLDGAAAPQALVSLNGAWFPPGGSGGWWYAPMAKLLALNPLVPHLAAWHAGNERVLRRLIAGTGSRLDDEGVRQYRQLLRDPRHVGAVLAMMAAWDLPPLLRELPRLAVPLHLVACAHDRAVPPALAGRVQALVPKARVHRLPALGHLAHEEDPAAVARLLATL